MMRIGIGLAIALGGLTGPVRTAAAETVARETEAVQAHVAQRLAVPITDVEVLHLGLQDGLPCGPGAEFSVQSSASEDFRGHADLRIHGVLESVPCGSARVRARLRVWKTVPVAKAYVQSGERIELAERRISIDEIDGIPVNLKSGPWEARVSLAEGSAITTRLVRPMPDAHSGEMVVIEAGTGALRVTASGRLLEHGRVGERVRVSNLATDQVVHGVLIEPGRVRAGGEG